MPPALSRRLNDTTAEVIGLRSPNLILFQVENSALKAESILQDSPCQVEEEYGSCEALTKT